MRNLTIEPLEPRNLLSAVADIVFLLDESGSQAWNANIEFGPALRPWVSGLVPTLEAKLALRGIGGGTFPTNANRYGVVAFGAGDEFDPAPRVRVLSFNGNTFVASTQFDDLLAQFHNAGDSEDGWFALSTAIGVEAVLGRYTFRNDAAVHFVLVTDEPRHHPQMPPSITFFDILNELRQPNIDTGSNQPEVLEDATVTSVAQYAFSTFNILEDGDFGPGTVLGDWDERILGIDADTLDRYSLDKNSATPANDQGPVGTPDDITIYTRRSAVDLFGHPDPNSVARFVQAVTKVGVGAETILDSGVTYGEIRDAFANPCSTHPNCPANQYDPELDDQDLTDSGSPTVIGQDDFEMEEYAFLTWEARGTTFDFRILTHSAAGLGGTFTGWEQPQNPDTKAWIQASRDNFVDFNNSDSLITLFNATVVDDIFEKVAIQRVDFDGFFPVPAALSSQVPASAFKAGQLSTGDIDMMTYYMENAALQTEPIKRAMDLDGSGVVDQLDGDRLIRKVFGTWAGDGNYDGLFNSGDQVQAFQAGEYEDANPNNSGFSEGDWSGDLEFDSGDFVKGHQGGGWEWAGDGKDNDGDGLIDENGEGYQDLNNDDQEDFRPIWAKHLASGSSFYRPSWS